MTSDEFLDAPDSTTAVVPSVVSSDDFLDSPINSDEFLDAPDGATPPAKQPDFSLNFQPKKVPTNSDELAAQNFQAEQQFEASQKKQQQAADDAKQKGITAFNQTPSVENYFAATGATPPEPLATKDKNYHVDNGQLIFDSSNPYDGLQQAVVDGAIDLKTAMGLNDQFQKGQQLAQKIAQLKKDSVGNPKIQALLHGATTGGAFLGGFAPGAAGGAEVGSLLGPVGSGVGAVVGGLAAGYGASKLAGKVLDTVGQYSDFVKSVNASAQLQPMYDAAGNLIAFSSQAPASIANFAKLGAMGGAGAVAKQAAIGAAGGLAFEGVVRPTFDYAVNTVQNQLGIPTDAVQPPTASSLIQNAALGLLLHGNQLKFKDYSSDEVANILIRGQIRDQAGVPLDVDGQDATTTILKKFDELNPRPSQGVNYQDFTAPLTSAEQSVYQGITKQLFNLKDEAQAAGVEPSEFIAKQVALPDFLGRAGKTLTTTGVALKNTDTVTGHDEGGTIPTSVTIPQPTKLLGGQPEIQQTEAAPPVQPTVPTAEPPAPTPLPQEAVNPTTLPSETKVFKDENEAAEFGFVKQGENYVPKSEAIQPPAPLNPGGAYADLSPELKAKSDAVQSAMQNEVAKVKLLQNMQGRHMDIAPKNFATPDAHLKLVLGKNAPSWKALSDAGIINAEPQPNGMVRVSVKQSPVSPPVQPATVSTTSQPVAGSATPPAPVASISEWQRPKPLEAKERRDLEERARQKIESGDQVIRGRLEKQLEDIKKRHQVSRRERDEAKTIGEKIRAEMDLVDDENALRKLAGEPQLSTDRPITEADQEKSRQWFAGRVKEIEGKLARGEPIDKKDRSDWVLGGRNKAELPAENLPPPVKTESVKPTSVQPENVQHPTGKTSALKPKKMSALRPKGSTSTPAKMVTLQSGRQVALPSLKPITGNVSAGKRIGELDAWLVKTAQDDAVTHGNDLQQSMFANMKAEKLSPADRSVLNDYLFGNPDGINLQSGGRVEIHSVGATEQPHKLFQKGEQVVMADGTQGEVSKSQTQWRETVQVLHPDGEVKSVPFNSVKRVVQKENVAGRETPAKLAGEVETPGSRPATPKTEVKSPLANLFDEKQKRMEEIKAKIRAKLTDKSMGITPKPIFDPEIVSLAGEMAKLYAEGGVKTFEQFAKHVHEEMPDMWERLKTILRGVWNTIAELLGLDEVSRDDANAVFTNLDKPAILPETSNERAIASEKENPPAGENIGGGVAPERGVRRAVSVSGESQARRSGVEPTGNQRDLRGEPVSTSIAPTENYVITPADRLGVGSVKVKAQDNLAAIRLVKQLEDEKRNPTQQEKEILVRYVGWGGLKGVFEPTNKQFSSEHQELKDLLTPDEYAAARASIQDAHYTSATIIQRGIYAALRQFGFTGGNMVEGGVGTGNFIGLMPEEMRAGSSYLGVERDPLTAKIAQYLYPKADIQNKGYQEADLSRDYFDASVGNPPFGEKSIYDKNFKAASKYSIHNYFIAKDLELTRPGGIVAKVVSRYFLDAQDPSARKYIATLGEFLGAIRLPNDAFKENANTSVVTDLVYFKRVPKGTVTNQDWTQVVDYKDPQSDTSWKINKWIAENPNMVLGTITKAERGLYRDDEMTVEPNPNADLGKELDFAVAQLPHGVYEANSAADDKRLTTPEYVSNVPDEVKPGGYYTENGKLYQRMPDVNGERTGQSVVGMKEGAVERVKAIIPIRNALNKLVSAELDDGSSDTQIAIVRKSLNNLYDAFVKKFGYLNSTTNRRAFYDDSDNTRVLGLERDYSSGVSAATAKLKGIPAVEPRAGKADIFTKRVNAPYREITKVETPKEALSVSLNQRGGVDLDYMGELTGKSHDELVKELGDLIFQTPEGFQSKEQYLSGNVRVKLQQAQEAVAAGATDLQKNVDALAAVIPKDIDPTDIIAPIGAPWIDAKDVSKFVTELTGSAPSVILYLKANAGWAFEHYDRSTASTQKWGTERMPFGTMFKILLNGKPVIVYDRKWDGDKEVNVVNQQETELANAKASELKDKWQEWVWADKERRDRLARIYNDTYNNYVDLKADGSHLTLPGASPIISLNPHQKNVAWRTIINGGEGLLQDAVVGSGKTFASIASMMELRRLGRVRKWLVAVPNHLTEQWKDQFLILYPNANLLVARSSDFTKENRQKLFSKALTGDYDAVILPHSSLKKIGTSPEVEREILKEILGEIVDTIQQMKDAERAGGRSGGSRQRAQMEKTKDNIDAKIKKLADIEGRDKVAGFEELGFDGLTVDEAHEFKNLFYTTQMQNVAGMGVPAGSAKAFDLYLKTRYLRKRFGGKAPIVFLTGTPISNSLVEMFTMQRYLQPQVLEQMGLKTLDAWAKVFADIKPVYEVDPTGTGYRMATRLANFQNVGELTAIYRNMADVITMNDLQAQAEARGGRFPVPKVAGGKPEIFVSDRTPEQADYFGVETQELDDEQKPMFDTEGNPVMSYPKGTILWRVDNMPDDPSEDNMLKLTNDARKAGLDMRLINPGAADRPTSKINVAVKEILATYKEWNSQKGTQLVFCDLSVPASARGKSTTTAKTTGVLDIADTPQAEKTVVADDADDTGKEQGVSLDELLADQSSFSVYDDMRAKLIKAGIPKEQIAFIHDFDTPEKKAKLFQRVNDGDVRVLFGSTAKMGAGTNVQRRIVALHHMDAPWRPSDLEQREGRAIRQGNLFYVEAMKKYKSPQEYDKDSSAFSVKIKRYATALTYDTRMWQLIEHKAAGIEGFRKADRSTRKIDDIGGEAANASDMKAAASGDPLIQQELQLRNDSNRLALLKKAWDRNRIELQNREAYLQGADQRYQSRVDELNARKAILDANTPHDEKGNTVFKFTMPDGKVADEKGVPLAYVADMISQSKRGYFGKYRGFDYSFEPVVRRVGDQDIKSVTFYKGKNSYVFNDRVTGFTGDEKLTGVGLFQRFDNNLDVSDADYAAAASKRDSENKALADVQAEAAKVFPKQEELTSLKNQHESVRTQLMNKWRNRVAPQQPPSEPAANLGEGLAEGEGMSPDDVRTAIQGVDTAGFPVSVITKDEAAKITGTPEARGYGGFFYQGKIYVVADNITPDDTEGLQQLMREEVAHGLLRTADGARQLQSVIDAGKLNLTDSEKQILRDKGYQEHQLLDEFIAKSARENRPWWKKVLDAIRAWLNKITNGKFTLSNEEIARILLKNIKRATTGIDDFGASGLPEVAASRNDYVVVGDVSNDGEVRLEDYSKSRANEELHTEAGFNNDVKFRYVDGKLYWWNEPDEVQRSNVEARLKKDYGITPKSSVFLDRHDVSSKAFNKHYDDMHFPRDIAPGEPVKRAQVAGVPEIGQERPTENIEATTKQIRDEIFDGTKPVSADSTDKAWNILTEMTNRDTGIARAQQIQKQLGDSRIGLSLFKGEIGQYALKLAAQGDPSLFQAWLDHSEDFVTSTGGGASTAGSALRGEGEFSSLPAINDLKAIYTTEKMRAAKNNIPHDAQAAFMDLVDQLSDLKLSPDDVESIVNSGRTTDGKSIQDLIGQAPPAARKPRTPVEREIEQDAQTYAEKKLAQLEQKHADVEWLKQDKKRSLIAQIISDALRGVSRDDNGELIRLDPSDPESELKIAPVDVNPLTVARETAQKLMDAGVDETVAGKLANEIERERTQVFSVKRDALIKRAANSNKISSLVESILASSYRAQSDPQWVHDTAARWFKDNGLSKEQAEAATRLFQKQFNAAMTKARERIGNQVLSKVGVLEREDLMKLISLGQDWLDKLAQKNGWKTPDDKQFGQLADLQDKFNDPDITSPERNALIEKMNSILRHLGNHDKAWLQALGESQAAALLSGVRTDTLHIFQPLMSIILKDLPVAFFSQPKDFLTLSKTFLNAAKNYFPRLQYAWQNDAYGFSNSKMIGHHNELKRQFELGVEAWKNGNYVGALRFIYAWQQYVFRALQTANEAGMAVKREFAMSLYGSAAMRDAGLDTKRIEQLAYAVPQMKENFYETAIAEGYDKNTAEIRAQEQTFDMMRKWISNQGVEPSAALRVADNSTFDSYSMTGFRDPRIKTSDEGFLRHFGFTQFQEYVAKLRKEGGIKSVVGISLFGFVNVPMRVMLYNANYFGYGIFRYGIYKYKTAGFSAFGKQHGGNQKTPWEQSFANDEQARQRLREALVGTAIGLGMLYLMYDSTTADDNSKKPFLVIPTGTGPGNKTLRDAWLKNGYRPYSLNVVADGRVIGAMPVTRANGVLAWMMGLIGAHDDHAWAKKDAEANGRPFNDSAAAELAQMAGSYYNIVGAQGIFQGIAHFQQIAQGGGGMGKMLAEVTSSIASSVLIPGKQLLAGVSQMIWGNPDRSSISAAIAANFPIIGAPWLHPQINRLGDPLGDNTWYGKISNLGLPIAFRVEDKPINREIYQTLLDKGIAPPDLRRTVLEERYGALTDAQFTQFAQSSGATIKNNIAGSLGQIQSSSPADGKKLVSEITRQADDLSASKLGLVAESKTPSPAPSNAAAIRRSATRRASSVGRVSQMRPRTASLHQKITRPHFQKIGRIRSHKTSGLRARKGSLYGRIRHRHMV